MTPAFTFSSPTSLCFQFLLLILLPLIFIPSSFPSSCFQFLLHILSLPPTYSTALAFTLTSSCFYSHPRPPALIYPLIYFPFLLPYHLPQFSSFLPPPAICFTSPPSLSVYSFFALFFNIFPLYPYPHHTLSPPASTLPLLTSTILSLHSSASHLQHPHSPPPLHPQPL